MGAPCHAIIVLLVVYESQVWTLFANYQVQCRYMLCSYILQSIKHVAKHDNEVMCLGD